MVQELAWGLESHYRTAGQLARELAGYGRHGRRGSSEASGEEAVEVRRVR